MSTGPEGSAFSYFADKYKKLLAQEGIKLILLPSKGSLDNLKKLANAKENVDVGFVQGGEADMVDIRKLVSLGSVSYQPLMIFYRGEPKRLLSEFKGQRLDIGVNFSGAHALSLQLLKENGIHPDDGKTVFIYGSENPAPALIDGNIDAVFTMGDSISLEEAARLAGTPGVHLYNFCQAEAYIRHSRYLCKSACFSMQRVKFMVLQAR